MRQKTILALFILLTSGLFFSGCDGDRCNCFCSGYDAEELILNDTVELKYGQPFCNSEDEFHISFDSLSEGRCPLGAICVWEGNASVRLTVRTTGGDSAIFRLNTHGSFLTDTLIDGIYFELIDLLPYPEINKDYQPEDYILQMLITN